jgi:hypothetical protein
LRLLSSNFEHCLSETGELDRWRDARRSLLFVVCALQDVFELHANPVSVIPPTQREDCTAVEENLFNPAHSAIAPLAARLPNRKFRCAPAAGKHQGWSAPSSTTCICCARWPPALRAAMRQAILRIPFTGPVCDDCLVAFMTNVWAASKQAKHH